MYRLMMIVTALALLAGCTDSPAPPTSIPDPPTPVPASGIRFQADCISVWDRQIDGDWKGLVMFTADGQVMVDSIPPGSHEITVTRWMPSPVVVRKDTVVIAGETAFALSCE